MSTKMDLRMHAHLLYDIINRQAGTLGKALLEGVMNSLDAGATRVDLRLEYDRFTLIDDGRGFADESEIENYFATFGTPHTEGDATYGRFRMGRGQIFAFARTVWTSNDFTMDVDVKGRGLTFLFDRVGQPVKGCRIDAMLYAPTNARGILTTFGEISRNCKYVAVPVIVNGEQVNTPPTGQKWTKETADAWIRTSSGGERGIDIYQQGVFVETIPAHEFGISGVVVTKPGKELMVNFARNQVIRSCPRFKKILADLGHQRKKLIKERVELDDSEIESMAHDLIHRPYARPATRTGCFVEDVTGRRWSMNQLCRVGAKQFKPLADLSIPYSVAPVGNPTGDRAMQEDRGLVLSSEFVRTFGGTVEHGFKKDSWFSRCFEHFRFVPLATLMKNTDEKCTLVDPSQETPLEKAVLSAMQSGSWGLLGEYDNRAAHRQLRIGISDVAEGWTDGKTYIAINRDFLLRNKPTPWGFSALARLLLHEYCHGDNTSGTHTHTPEFYRKYHDRSRDLHYATHRMYEAYAQIVIRKGGQQARKYAAKLTEVTGAERALFGESMQESSIAAQASKPLTP